MNLNPLAQSLRLSLKIAKVKLAMALISYNPQAVAKFTLEINQIQARQKKLDGLQKLLIQSANFKMQRGSYQVFKQLRTQSQSLQGKLPDFLKYKITPMAPIPVVLAVKPDRPDVAPVYGLKDPFSPSQRLSIYWISEFSAGKGEQMSWLKNKHRKKDSCSISLEERNQSLEIYDSASASDLTNFARRPSQISNSIMKRKAFTSADKAV